MLGKLIQDFHCKRSEDLHFKETEEERKIMCESVKKYGDERALQTTITLVIQLMQNMKYTLEQALDVLGINGKDRVSVINRIKG